MAFDPWSLLLSFLAGSIGLVLFVYGKKQVRLPQLVGGLLFMVYPYFAPSVPWMLAIGAALGLGLWWVIRLGW
jgi:hypothetical protein